MKCNHGKSVSVEYYQILSLFDEYYNNQWVPMGDNFPWKNDPLAVKNARVLLRLTRKTSGLFQEVQLETWEGRGQLRFLYQNRTPGTLQLNSWS